MAVRKNTIKNVCGGEWIVVCTAIFKSREKSVADSLSATDSVSN